MPPQELNTTEFEGEDSPAHLDKSYVTTTKDTKWEIIWTNVILLTVMHVTGLYGAYLFFTLAADFKTVLFGYIWGYAGGLGVTAGSHRYWSHKSYKAKWPLHLMLMIFHSIASEGPAYDWARDHRLHHRFSETNADPYNAKRGFFFAHCGWLMMKKHPDIKANAHQIDISDLEEDRILMFQKRNYVYLSLIFGIILPIIIPKLLWGATWHDAIFISMYRYILILNSSWLVNSAAHIYGFKPYDKNIHPAENFIVSHYSLGEGFHNYHHTYPWDYRTSELGGYALNFTKAFIDFMAYIGWAYDLKTVPTEVIEKRKIRTGDGSEHKILKKLI